MSAEPPLLRVTVHSINVHSSNFSTNDSFDSPFTDNTTMTEVTFTGGAFTHLPFAGKIGLGIFLGMIIFSSIAGNILVIIAILTERSLRKASNYFYVSLAVADTLVAVGVMTFALANDILGYWVFGPTYCNIWLCSDVMCSTASILNLCAISLDRYIHIRKPYTYDRIMSPRRTLLCIGALWLLSALISVIPIQLGWHKTDDYEQYVGDKFICLLEFNKWYAVISSVVSFVIPCIIMVAIYIKLFLFARKHVESIKKTWTTGVNLNGSPDGSRPHSNQYKPSDHKAAITLGIIMGSFLFCWVPFFTINIVGAFCSTCIPGSLFAAFTWLGYLNSMANPIIYPIFNKEFRVAFGRLLRPNCNDCVKTHKPNQKTYEYGKPIRTNGTSLGPAAEYGALTAVRKSSASPLMNDHVTTL